ncbi:MULTISPECIES: hypothetical protein [unclassified Mesorhizobium]|uniref:hypothetical protein n=1 Tax=unclassified Mesorhizobium TaxID=325217 RepID=UPI00167A7908|nr:MULTISPECIES: hypothetical protein [unclassified Mesorhizobium]
MSTQGTSVSSEQRGYGRGLILGLTMAESMLLLVFCLLLAAGAIIARERSTSERIKADKLAIEIELQKQKDSNALLAEKLEVFRKTVAGSDELEKEWRELELAKKTVDQILETGLTLEEVKKQAPILLELRKNELTLSEVKEGTDVIKKLREKGISANDVAELVPAAARLRDSGLTADDVEKLAPAIKVLRDKVVVTLSKQTPDEQLLEVIRKAKESEGNAKPHEWPPIISLSETNGYFFKSGSAELSPSFDAALRENTAGQIADIAAKYAVDVVEVIGHTDEQKISRLGSNLDAELQDVLGGTAPVGVLHPADNAGLGLARAIAVAKVLKSVPALQAVTILPMSGAQLILPDDTLTNGTQAGDVKSRRRIEIRVRKRNSPSTTEVGAKIQ